MARTIPRFSRSTYVGDTTVQVARQLQQAEQVARAIRRAVALQHTEPGMRPEGRC